MNKIKFLLCFALAVSGIEGRGQIYINSYRFGVADLLLDSFPNSHVAYSLRKLDKDYAGNCITIRKPNGDTTNVAFSGEFIDTSFIKSWCATDSCFVSRWYDQSPNGYHAIQDTNNRRPLIYNGTSLHYFGDKLGLFFSNSFMYVRNSAALFNIMHNGTVTSTAIVARTGTVSSPDTSYQYIANWSAEAGNPGFRFTFDDRISQGGNNRFLHVVYDGVNANIVNTTTLGALTANAKQLIFINSDADLTPAIDRSLVYVNNGSVLQNNTNSASPTTSNAVNNFRIGGGIGVINFTGTFYEVIIWNANRSGDRTNIQKNINNFYSIY